MYAETTAKWILGQKVNLKFEKFYYKLILNIENSYKSIDAYQAFRYFSISYMPNLTFKAGWHMWNLFYHHSSIPINMGRIKYMKISQTIHKCIWLCSAAKQYCKSTSFLFVLFTKLICHVKHISYHSSLEQNIFLLYIISGYSSVILFFKMSCQSTLKCYVANQIQETCNNIAYLIWLFNENIIPYD